MYTCISASNEEIMKKNKWILREIWVVMQGVIHDCIAVPPTDLRFQGDIF